MWLPSTQETRMIQLYVFEFKTLRLSVEVIYDVGVGDTMTNWVDG